MRSHNRISLVAAALLLSFAATAQAAFNTTTTTAAPATASPGTTVVLSTSVKSSAAASNMIVDLEVYNASGQKLGQTYYFGQGFTAGETRPYHYDFNVPAGMAAGKYTFMVGVFTAGWASDVYWNSSAASFTVTSTVVGSQPSSPTKVPVTPAGLSATAGNALATLKWSASSGATSYHVKRATTSGGPYTQIAAPTSTSYTDTSLTNGTTYYYVVSALDSAGESTNSTQASAKPSAPVTTPPPTPPSPPTTSGTWTDVTPAGVDLTDVLSCQNYGTETVQADPAHPSNLYTEFNCQGIWKSTDYGATWTGPINTGSNAAAVSDCAGGITVAPNSTASVPTIYEACIRGTGTGFWKSVDGGVNWTSYFVAPSGTSRQDYYPPVVDPYDSNHLLMAGHEMDYLVQSTDGGQTWSNVSMAGGMLENGGTGAIFFINTGNASTTRGTWLWMAQQAGGVYGTWRTTNNGSSWTQVDKNEHPHGFSQIYQPDNHGVLYMAGAYSNLGWGVLRSTDYGQTWAHVGGTSNETVVLGTSTNVYAMFGYPVGIGGINDPAFEIASQPGTGTWIAPGVPAALNQGAGQIVIVNNGTNNILVGAMWNNGVWRYVEP